MDLLDFKDPELYFESSPPKHVAELLFVASREYGSPAAEAALQKAERIAPRSLDVLVASFRYHYYQHDLIRAKSAGHAAVDEVAQELGLPEWRKVEFAHFERAFRRDPGAARFYLHALKGLACLSMRLGSMEEAEAQLERVIALDEHDRFGCRALLDILSRQMAPRQEENPELSETP